MILEGIWRLRSSGRTNRGLRGFALSLKSGCGCSGASNWLEKGRVEVVVALFEKMPVSVVCGVLPEELLSGNVLESPAMVAVKGS